MQVRTVKARRVVCFFTSLFLSLPGSFHPPLHAQSAFNPKPEFVPVIPRIDIPGRFGTVEERLPPTHREEWVGAPFVIHIQSVHGNYEAEKNTARLLHFLKKKYGAGLLLLEGGAGEVDPALFDLFPVRRDLNVRVADFFLRRAELCGAELFLIETLGKVKTEAYGIEDTDAYRRNRLAFQKVLREKEKSDGFLRSLDSQVKHLVNSQLKPSVRRFLREFEAYAKGERDEIAFLSFLKKEAKQELEIDLDQASHQEDWPMLVRFFRLQTLERKLDRSLAEREKDRFLSKLEKFAVSPELLARIRGIVEKPGNFHPETRPAFEELLEALPSNFDFKDFSHLKFLIQSVVLQSELEGKRLFGEVDNLAERIAEALAATEEEKKLLPLLREVRLLERLFRLELKREEFEMILSKGKKSLLPSAVWRRLFEANGSGSKGRPADTESLKEMDRLSGLAVSFYEGAIEREQFMRENISSLLGRAGSKPVVLVTGGFHAEGLKELLRGQGLNYVRVTPRMNGPAVPDSYHRAMLAKDKRPFETAQIANLLKLQPVQRLVELAAHDPSYVRYLAGQLAQAIREAGFGAEELAGRDSALFERQYRLHLTVLGSDGTVSPLAHFRFLPHQLPPSRLSTRSEARLGELREAVHWDWIEGKLDAANEANLRVVLDDLKEGLEKKDKTLEQEAFLTLSVLLRANPELAKLPVYQTSVQQVTEAFANQLPFVQAVTGRGSGVSLEQLMALGVKIYAPETSWTAPFLSVETAENSTLVHWLVLNRPKRKDRMIQVFFDYDTGILPDQSQRGRFPALALFIESAPVEEVQENFIHLLPSTPRNKDPQRSYGHFFRRYETSGGKRLGFMFWTPRGSNASSAAALRRFHSGRLGEVQALGAGLLATAVLAGSNVFFPEETFGRNPLGLDPETELAARLYRTFERRFVAVLRKYNAYRDPSLIEPVGGSPFDQEKHLERLAASQNTSLDESLLPEKNWFFPSRKGSDELIGDFRAVEGMTLQKEKRAEFVSEVGRVVEDYLRAFRARKELLAAGAPAEIQAVLGQAGISSEFRQSYWQDKIVTDPFINRDDEKGTENYLEKTKSALENGTLLFAALADPEKFRTEIALYFPKVKLARAELSSGQTAVLRSDQTGKLLRRESRRANHSVPDDQAAGRRSTDWRAEARVTEILMDGIHGLGVRSSKSGRKRAESRIEDSRFAVVSNPVPERLSLRELRRTLREEKFRRFFSSYPKRLLLLTFPGEVPEAVSEGIYRESGERILLFGGDYGEITQSLFVSPGNYSNLSQANRRVISRLLPQASKLKGGEPVKSLELGKFALVAAREDFLRELPRRVSKEFREVSLTGLTPEELLKAYLLFGIPIAALPYGDFQNAALSERYPELSFEMDDLSQSLTVSFRSNALARIRARVRANRYASRSA